MLGQLTKAQIDLEYVQEAADGSARMWQAVAGLGKAVTLGQVATYLVEAGLVASGASSGALVVLTDDRRELRLVHAIGAIAEPVGLDRHLPLSASFPLVDAVRSRQELWISSPAELEARYPDLVPEPGAGAWAVLPLLVDTIVLGAVGWSFPGRRITTAQRAGLRILARAGGDAVYRVGLFASERRARADAEIARYDLANRIASLENERTALVAAQASRDARADRCYQRDALMGEVSALLDSTIDPAPALEHVARLSLPLLGEWCAIDVLAEDGRLQRSAEVHTDPSKNLALHAKHRAARGFGRRLPRALREGKPITMIGLTPGGPRRGGLGARQLRSLQELGLNRLVVVPLRVRGRTVGTLSFGCEHATRGYSEGELALALRLGRRCAASIEYARLYGMAQRAMQDREEFVAATSHELRTPLSHIKGFVSTLRTTDTDWDAETRDDFLAEIEREADRLTQLVENLLEMSRIDSGGLDPAARSALVPAALVAAGVDRVGGSVGEHVLDIRLADDLPPVWADGSQVERVIANLLDNAAKYSPPDEPIGIIGRLTGDVVSLRIEDRGLGIPPEHVERIFEPFYREPTAGYPAKPGTGLGLAICRSIIRAQNGRIWAEQRAGGGAAFVFTLPVAASSRKA
jgi:signal transduction histidine kinase